MAGRDRNAGGAERPSRCASREPVRARPTGVLLASQRSAREKRAPNLWAVVVAGVAVVPVAVVVVAAGSYPCRGRTSSGRSCGASFHLPERLDCWSHWAPLQD